MHIHRPKPLHGVREFAGEVAVIILGILIALGLEQVAEAAQHGREAAEARQTVREEVSTDLTRANQRVLRQACIDHRLDELQQILDHRTTDGRFTRPNWIGRPSRYAIESSRWEAATHSGRVSLLGNREQAAFGFMYAMLAYYYEMENGEQLVWARLQALQGVDHLSPDGLLSIRQLLGEARFYNGSIRQVSHHILDRGSALGLRPAPRADNSTTACWPMTLTAAQIERMALSSGDRANAEAALAFDVLPPGPGAGP